MNSTVKKYLLTDFIIWVCCKILIKILFDIGRFFPTSYDSIAWQCLDGAFDGVSGVFAAWFMGAIASGIPLFSYGALAAYIMLFFAIHHKNAERANFLLTGILILTILTIWIESYLAIFFPPNSVESACNYTVNISLLVLSIPIIGFFDIFFTVIRFPLTFNLVKEVDRISSSRNTIQSQNNNNSKNLFVSLLLSTILFGTGGYFYLGQVTKGIFMTLIAFWCLLSQDGEPVFVTVYLLSIIDIYRLTQRNNKYREVNGWETCFNLYTTMLVFIVVSIGTQLPIFNQTM